VEFIEELNTAVFASKPTTTTTTTTRNKRSE